MSRFIGTLALFTLLLPLGRAQAANTNAIIFIADDVSWNDYGCYGNPAARTPNIDSLADNGIRFDRAYLTASSCSPSRSSIITGRYPHNNGKAAELHEPISVHLPWFPELLREAGYYTALSGKHHMKTTKPDAGQSPRPEPFDAVDGGRVPGNSGGSANWLKVTKDRPRDKPFFFWFASYDAHRGWDADKQWDEERYGRMHQAKDVVVPPFLVDDAETREDLASYYNEVTRFDYHIGVVVEELQRQGVFEDTLIFVLADNGRPFPRAKTRLHDSGMRTALVAHWAKAMKWSGPSDQLVSVIDLAPTILQAGGVKVPKTMQGHSMMPLFEKPEAAIREYAFSEHNWHDYEAFGRSIRHGDFLLLRNERVELAWQGPADSVRSASHASLLQQQTADKLTAAQADVFTSPRPAIELYDVPSDPFQLKNLAGIPEHRATERELTRVLDQWMKETGDSVPEKLSPDTFDRRTGMRIDKKQIDAEGAITPGEDRGADRINAKGPY
ncbi:MAG: sulfatase [Planctomycetota bacterium]